jgi:23S rRNA pseudouridine1911/1915/1917 synthase
LVGEDRPLDILFEDEHVIVVNKPAGLVVHPAAGHAAGTLVNALIGYAPELEALPGAVLCIVWTKRPPGSCV